MFFESFESRQMFSIGIPTTIVVIPKLTIPPLTVNLVPATTAKTTTSAKATVNLATTPAPSQGTVIKQGTNSTLAGVVQGTPDPAKLGSTPLGPVTSTLPGGLNLSTDPNARPSAADLEDANAFRSFFNSIANSAMQGLLAEYGKSLTDLGTLTGSTDPTGKIDFLGMVMKDIQAQTGTGQLGTIGGIDPREADGDVAGGLGVNPTDAEVAAAIKAQQAKDNAAATTPAPAPAPAATPAKDAGETVATYLLDVVVEKFGPPGPATTLLEGPGFVEKVTGDARDLLNGFIAIFKSGDKDPRNNPSELTSPDGDVALEPQQQKIVNEAMAFFNKYTANQPTLHDLGTSLISQPARGDDGSVIPKPDKNQLLASGQAPHKDMSPYINPGSGDDGNTPVTGTAPTATKAVVKDPPMPGVDTDSPGIAPPTSGVTTGPGGTTTGVSPSTPKQ